MILSVVTFILVLSTLVLIHELGHFLIARFIGVRVEEFGLGLPPKIIGKKIGGTEYSLNWLPIGGFVRLAGEDDSDEQLPAGVPKTRLKQYFWARTKKERASILSAGVFMNFLLAVIITTGLLLSGVQVPSGRVHVEDVQKNSPAYVAGIKAGDVIRFISVDQNGQPKKIPIKTTGDLIKNIKLAAGEMITVTVQSGSTERSVVIVPRKNPPQGEGPLGVVISDLEIRTYPFYSAPIEAVKINLDLAWQMLVGIGTTLWGLVTLKNLSPDVAGPIGIAQVTGKAVQFGLRAVIEFTSILSLNLAVLNILPIPALDGGRLLFVFIEKIIGHKVKPAFEKSTHQIGMIILLILVLLVSLNDIMRLSRGG